MYFTVQQKISNMCFFFFHYIICCLNYITFQIFLICSYQCLFILLDQTYIYHEISYMDLHLDSMERKI